MVARNPETGVRVSTAPSPAAVWFMGALTTFRADDELGAVMEHACPPDFATPLHSQPDDAEAFYVLGGDVTFYVAGERIPATTGDYVHIGAGAPHAFRVTSAEGARLLNITTSQHADFFRTGGTAALEGDTVPAPDMDAVMAAAAACNVQIVGPPLEAIGEPAARRESQVA